MSDRTVALGIASGLARGINQGTSNLVNIMQAGYKLKQNKELLDLKKKAVEKDIAIAPYEKDKLISEIDSNKARVAYYTALTKVKGEGAQTTLDQTKDMYDEFNLALNQFRQPDGSLAFGDGTSIDFKNMKIAKQKGNINDTAFLGNDTRQPPAQAPEAMPLPEGITEEDLAHTMKLHNLTREEILKRIKK